MVEGLVDERGPTAAVRVVQGRSFVQVAPVTVRLALGLRLRRGQRRRGRKGDEESELVAGSHCSNEVAVRFVVQILDIITFASSVLYFKKLTSRYNNNSIEQLKSRTQNS